VQQQCQHIGPPYLRRRQAVTLLSFGLGVLELKQMKQEGYDMPFSGAYNSCNVGYWPDITTTIRHCPSDKWFRCFGWEIFFMGAGSSSYSLYRNRSYTTLFLKNALSDWQEDHFKDFLKSTLNALPAL
jgi:hypothetical protein